MWPQHHMSALPFSSFSIFPPYYLTPLLFNIIQDSNLEKHVILLNYIIGEGLHASTIYKGIRNGQDSNYDIEIHCYDR